MIDDKKLEGIYRKVKAVIDSTYDTGKLPKGLGSPLEFREFERMCRSYFARRLDWTLVGSVAKALGKYGVPVREDGVGFVLDFEK